MHSPESVHSPDISTAKNQNPIIMVLRGVTHNTDGRWLLLKRSAKSKTWPGYWEFPGGKVDPGEDLNAAFTREMREETGLYAEPGKLLDAFDWDRGDRRIVYLVFLIENLSGNFTISDEHDDFGWFSSEELQELEVSPPLIRVVDKITAR